MSICVGFIKATRMQIFLLDGSFGTPCRNKNKHDTRAGVAEPHIVSVGGASTSPIVRLRFGLRIKLLLQPPKSKINHTENLKI